MKIVYAEGVKITESEPNWWNDKVEPADPVKNRARIQEALPIAKSADAVVLVLGTNESTSREAWATRTSATRRTSRSRASSRSWWTPSSRSASRPSPC